MAFERHRDKNGEISRKHGNTLIGTLRKTYGVDFAKGCAESERLSDVLHKMDEPYLGKLVRDYEAGKMQKAERTLLVWHPQRLLSAFFMWPDCGLMVGIKPFAADSAASPRLCAGPLGS